MQWNRSTEADESCLATTRKDLRRQRRHLSSSVIVGSCFTYTLFEYADARGNKSISHATCTLWYTAHPVYQHIFNFGFYRFIPVYYYYYSFLLQFRYFLFELHLHSNRFSLFFRFLFTFNSVAPLRVDGFHFSNFSLSYLNSIQ
jgi:hypothetical protein